MDMFDFMEMLMRELEEQERRKRNQSALHQSKVSKTPSVDPRDYDGYKQEVVNGEATEYVYIDDEWEELPLENDGGVRISGTTVTVDLSEYDIPEGVDTVKDVTFNNGILDVEFESGDDNV